MKRSAFNRRRAPHVPLEPREYLRQRRDRRLERNTTALHEAKTWADQHGFSLRVNNEGHHWMWQKNGLLAEWWPSSAKLVFNRNYDRCVDAYDWRTVISFLETGSAGLGDAEERHGTCPQRS